MDLTTNYSLGKPLDSEDYDIAVPNANMDIIDGKLKTAIDGSGGAVGLIPWTNFAATLRREDDTVVAGTTIAFARYMRIGKTVFYKGRATNTGIITNAAISLPTGAGLTPVRRELSIGSAVISDVAITGSQMYSGRMNSDKTKLVCWSLTGGFVDMPANSTFHWDVSYEVS